MIHALTLSQMRCLEQKGNQEGISYYQMMQNAGIGAAQSIFQDMLEPEERQCVVLCGKGNNGGDGFVTAGTLADMGVQVSIVLVDGQPYREPARQAFQDYVLEKKLPVVSLAEQPKRAACLLSESFAVVDAIYGIGFTGQLSPAIQTLLQAVKPYQRVYAMDLPSGCNARTGQASTGVLPAHRTFSFGAYKLGQFLEPCKSLSGSVVKINLGIPSGCYPTDTPLLVGPEDLVHFLRDLNPRGHKGTFGRLLCVTGCRQYAGASYFSAAAAARSGVGIVTVASTEPVLSRLFPLLPEATALPLEETAEGYISSLSLPLLEKLLPRCQALLLGCGLGLSPETEKLVQSLLSRATIPIVLDADGLNAAAKYPPIWDAHTGPLITTPHPGEMARLLGCEVQQVLEDRIGCARAFSKRSNGVVVLKSDQTVVFHPDGKCALLYNAANPGLGKGGSGDLLAGFAASFCAQGYPPFEAAVAAVLLHSTCGRLAAEGYSERAMLPSDLLKMTGKAFSQCHQWL